MNPAVIEVRIWGQRVGAVAPDAGLGCYVFAYDPAWRRTGIELAPLTMPLADTSPIFAFPNLAEPSYHRLPGLLADALPDDFGNALIDVWMARKGMDKNAVTALDRVAYMGKRGMGALEFKPARGAHRETVEPLQMQNLVEAARKVIQGDRSGDVHAQAALANIIRVGTSAGGARAKAVVTWNPQTNEIRSGQFDAAEGFQHWMLKFDGMGKDLDLGGSADYGRIEYAYHLMAQAAGINMSECRLLQENGRAHFMTRRFDREAPRFDPDVNVRQTLKHHVQTLCAMDHLDFKQRATHAYAQLFIVLAKLKLGDEANTQAFRRMAFNVMAKNCDDHTKNFAFRLRQGEAWELAPAYDLTYAHNPQGQWTYQHRLGVNGKFSNITRADLLREADRFGVRRPLGLIADVRAALERWPAFAAEAGLGANTVEGIARKFEWI